MNVYFNCPICESGSTPLFYAGGHRMYRCINCSLAFVHPMPSEGFLIKFYSKFHRETTQGGYYDFIEERMKSDFSYKIRQIKSYLPEKNLRLIDVGSGKGFFVKRCNDAGIDAIGVDLSDTATKFAKSKLGVSAINGKIEDLSDRLEPADVVTFWATIEHLRNPFDTLHAIKKVLAPGGLLFLDTGIGNDWLDKLLPGYVQWYDPPQHLHVHSKQSISILLEKCGFKVVKVDTLFERSAFRKYLRIMRGIVGGVSLRIASEISRIKVAEPFEFTRFPIGNLMQVVARSDK